MVVVVFLVIVRILLAGSECPPWLHPVPLVLVLDPSCLALSVKNLLKKGRHAEMMATVGSI